MKKRIVISLGITLILFLGINFLGIKTFLNGKYEVKRSIDSIGYTSSYIIFNENLKLDSDKEKSLIEKIIKEEVMYSENNVDKKSKCLGQSEIVFRMPNNQYIVGVNNKDKKLKFLGKIVIDKRDKQNRKYIEKDENFQDILMHLSNDIMWT